VFAHCPNLNCISCIFYVFLVDSVDTSSARNVQDIRDLQERRNVQEMYKKYEIYKKYKKCTRNMESTRNRRQLAECYRPLSYGSELDPSKYIQYRREIQEIWRNMESIRNARNEQEKRNLCIATLPKSFNNLVSISYHETSLNDVFRRVLNWQLTWVMAHSRISITFLYQTRFIRWLSWVWTESLW